ncbi:Gfo/Idh/MocA family protein [Paenibacillus sp. sgz302251]|uniref:Gfo/Idh/MocA family protein n=1 Tax=Paenibacillus sp. sgz302251 TaxID=3414493 RepID=UPI003C7E9233
MRKVKVGLIGCGMISGAYLKSCTEKYDIMEIVACADLVPELARQRAQEFGISKALTVEELLSDSEIELVINLTIPKAHAEINLLALEAGKHVYVEKPFAVRRDDAKKVIELAASKNLRVGGAPDTFLGGGLQTCRKLIDEGWIGTPFSADARIMMGNASESTHPNGAFWFQEGGDPMMDMGPYYITALVHLLGPIVRVVGSAQRLHDTVTFIHPKSPLYGTQIPLEIPMNISGVLDFENGAVGTITTSKEGYGYMPRLEVYGTQGTLICNDPNAFGGTIYIQRRDGERKEVAYTHGFTDESRGLGAADMCYAIATGRQHRANGELTYHVLDVMHSIQESSRENSHIQIGSRCDRPKPLPLGLRFNTLDT